MLRWIFRLFAGLALIAALSLPGRAQDAAAVDALKAGLTLMRAGDWDGALDAAGPPGSLGRDIVQWNRLRASKGTFAETLDFLRRRPDWPGLALLKKRSEVTIPEDADYATIIDYFHDRKPGTGTGSLRLAHALWETGAKQAAMAEAIRGWTTLSLSEEEEAGFRKDWPKTTRHSHEKRLDMLLWRGLTDEAQRMFDLVPAGWQALARARIALAEDKSGVDALIAAVPKSLAGDPGLAFERMQWRARHGYNDSAIELMLARSASAESLGDPERWAGWRLTLARWALRNDKPKTAYRLAAEHHIKSGNSRDELEWLAGYVALQKLSDAETALSHFRRFAAGVESPISLGRAGYWEGRALDALGRKDEAKAAYGLGGANQSSFYGLLAAEKAGLAMDPALTGRESFPDYHQAAFWGSELMDAARLSLAAGELYYARRFVIQLSERLDHTGLGQLTDWAADAKAPHLEIAVAKYALAFHGELLLGPYFPIPDIGHGAQTVPRALEMAISRRESEFNPEVVSGAGARGLMQLMPGTAKDMAKRLSIAYAPDRLTSEFAYNTRLGSEYLAYLIEKFGNNPVLIAAAYNAGPGRAQQWIDQFGDPRDAGTDVVDWIENIPLDETRNYVMRVTESLPAYRARLTGHVEPIHFLEELKGQ